MYALEGFLARLHESAHAKRLVLEGGVLMAAFGARRPTRDVDLSARDVVNDAATISAVIRDVLGMPVEDGLEFNAGAIGAEVIREEDTYSGIRVTVPCRLASARLHFHVDVNVGDPIYPEPIAVALPRLLGGEPLVVIGYPISMILAEKIVTALQRSTANTRWRDFVDIAELARRHALPETELRLALECVAEHRQVELRELAVSLAGFGTVAQAKWSAWRRKQRLEDRVPGRFDNLLAEVTAFCDPVLSSGVGVRAWTPKAAAWQ